MMTAVYLFAAVPISPAFFLGPLAALLLASRPRTRREWFWIALPVVVLAAWLQLPTSLAEQTVRASAVFFVGSFVAVTLAGMRTLIGRSIAAVTIAALATTAWFLALHFRFATVESELIAQTWEAWRNFYANLPADLPPPGDFFTEWSSADQARQFAAGLTAGATVFPAFLALWALAGVRLAWGWYHRIARTPFPPPAGQFRNFRFNDQLIWLLVGALAAALLGHVRPVVLAGTNVLLVIGVLYSLRGLAIMRMSVLRASPVFVGLLILMMLALVPVSPLILAMIGITDTWVDFRRRMAPPTGAAT